MARIHVVVAETAKDVEAEFIADEFARSADMALAGGGVASVQDIDALLAAMPPDVPRALVVVGPEEATAFVERRFVGSERLVVVRVNVPYGAVVHTAFSDIGLQKLLEQVRVLAATPRSPPRDAETEAHPLLEAALAWIHGTMRHAVANARRGEHGDWPGLTVAPASVVAQLDARGSQEDEALRETDLALSTALREAQDNAEPLATIAKSLDLSPLEFRLFLLAVAPEADGLYQRCIGLLLDDLGRRVGTLGLYASMLGAATPVRRTLESSGALARWRLLDAMPGWLPPADEPLRPDPAVTAWILGQHDALLQDARVRRVLHAGAWAGAALIDSPSAQARAEDLLDRLGTASTHWLVLDDNDPTAWRALLELASRERDVALLRVDGVRLAGLDERELEETALRLARMARLTDQPLAIDLTGAGDELDEPARRFLAALGDAGARAFVLCEENPRIARCLGRMPFDRVAGPALDADALRAAVVASARGAGVALDEAQATEIAQRHALDVDGLHRAMRIAASSPAVNADAAQRLDAWLAASRQVASEGVSRLVERVEPVFVLDDVVLPEDRKAQLREIVDNVRLSARVMDEWKFGAQLPYGRGVTALFQGPSGTGKTMAALALARQLGIPLLRIDLSRVVSKYIGETEKNIDRVFEDAERSRSALLIDEADALLGKRSEVKDAHDRYANIEVAYLLQRMEAYTGLAILTTNLGRNLDVAFLRRLRFILDFPRPDAAAREAIWRSCLPVESHVLDDAAFRQLARRIELTGGHIRQITLRAAFLAAAEDTRIALAHVARAANAEFAKLGLPAVALEPVEARQAA